jgi:hypothetical protein
MTSATPATTSPAPAYPRYFRIAGHRVNSYQLFLCVGIYAGILTSAAVGDRSGISPLHARPTVVRGMLVNRVVAAAMAIVAGAGFLWRVT